MIDPGKADDESPDPGSENVRETRKHMCLRLIRERGIINKAFGDTLCANPNWDMLLDLYLAELDRRPIYQSALCQAARIPESSAHRWTVKLAELGVLVRESDAADRRRVRVTLAPATSVALSQIMKACAI